MNKGLTCFLHCSIPDARFLSENINALYDDDGIFKHDHITRSYIVPLSN